MAEFLGEYGLFLAKAVTVLVVMVVLLVLMFGNLRGMILEARGREPDGLEVKRLNDFYRELSQALQRSLLDRPSFKRLAKDTKKQRKRERKGKVPPRSRRIFVLDFKGDLRASQVSSLREEISAIVSIATKEDEVVLRLENSGGTVHEHGLAASQLMRLKQHGIPLTVVVDKVAASGGYMMACAADKLIAAPFAVVGSIGVLAQVPNIHRALTDHGVDVEQITAGKYKRTVTILGKNTDEDRAKLKSELEEVHALFKKLVAEQRPQLDIEKVATGEHWYGKQAIDLGLIDELGSSDDYLLAALPTADLYQVRFRSRVRLQERARGMVRALVEELSSALRAEV